MSSALRSCLEMLNDGRFHSGTELATELAVSRTTVWKLISQLETMGCGLERVHGRGYRLIQPLEWLDAERIRRRLNPGVAPQIETFFSVESTATQLAAANQPSGTVYLAEHQQAGRGRSQRQWLSPLSSNIYCSLCWQFPVGLSQLAGLSLAVGVMVVQALAEFGLALQLKWPNDIVVEQQKLGGLLLELSGDGQGPSTAIISVGLNVSLPAAVKSQLDRPVSDLQSHTSQTLSRNDCIAAILNQWWHGLAQFSTTGFAAFQGQWQQMDALRNQKIELQMGKDVWAGTAVGVDPFGHLLLDTGAGVQRIHSGEVTKVYW